MDDHQTRLRIENEILARLEKRYSEEEQANHLMSLLMEGYALSSAATLALEPDGRSFSVFAHRGLSGNFIKDMYTRPVLPLVEAAMAGEVDVAEGDARAKDPAFRLEHEYATLFAVPCRLQEETIGVFIADSKRRNMLTPETKDVFRACARLATLFLAMRNLRAKISRVPEADSVTGLSSFRHFHEALHRELSRGRKFGHTVSLVFLKIRNLRRINEMYGHVVADRALREVASRIRANVREVDSVSRTGGTVYVVMPQMDKADAAKTAGRIVATMESSPIGEGDVKLKLAAGVAAFPKDGESERVLLPHVESMVHESVRKGGNTVSVFKG